MKLRSLLAVALLAPAVTLAAPATGTKASSKSGPKPAPAQTSSATEGTALAGLEVGGFLGYETDDVSGFSLRLDGELPFRQLAPQVKLSLVGSVGYSRLTWNAPFDTKITANVLKLVPAARFTIPLAPQFSVFGDVGLGLAYVSAKVDFPSSLNALGVPDVSDSTINVMMRFGAGAWYQLNPQLKLGAMLELDPIFGDFGFKTTNGVNGGSQTTFLILAGLMYRL